MSGRRVEVIPFYADHGRRIMTCGLSSLHLRVRRWGGRVDDDVVLALAHLSEMQPVVTKQATINVSMEESKHDSYMHCSTSAQRKRHYNDLSYTIPHQLLRDNTRNIAMVHAYTRKGGLEMTVLQ